MNNEGAMDEAMRDPRAQPWAARLRRRIETIGSRGRLSGDDVRFILNLVVSADPPMNVSAIGPWVAKFVPRADREVARVQALRGVRYIDATRSDVIDLLHEAVGFRVDMNIALSRHQLPEGQGAVDSYMRCTKAVLEASQGNIRNFEKRDAEEAVRLTRMIWAGLRDARVFEFPIPIWDGLSKDAIRAIAVWYENRSAEVFPTDTGAIQRIRKLGEQLPFPEKLPFERVFIGIGAGVVLDETMAMARHAFRSEKHERATLVGAELLGYLIDGPGKTIFEMVRFVHEADDYIMPVSVYCDGAWDTAETLAPWLVHGLIAAINEHNTVVINHAPTLGMKFNAKKISKAAKLGFLPKPYYTLRMRHRVIDESELEPRGSGRSHILSRRYDRRFHERCFIERGPVPIDPKLEAKLLKYGYRFVGLTMEAEDHRRLAKRNIPPKRFDEWMAIKVREIPEKVCGSPELPYIPAVRVPEHRA